MAADLHDSVLHTLALVRRSANDPRQVVSLARRQERELRTWLAGGPPVSSNSPRCRTRRRGRRCRDRFGVPIEIVRWATARSTTSVEALIGATREAMVNAAKHSGAPSIAVYLEVDRDQVTLFVRDRGRGLRRGAVTTDRRRDRESIIGRMDRHGGTAEMRCRLGSGTEVELSRSGSREHATSRACSSSTTITSSSRGARRDRRRRRRGRGCIGRRLRDRADRRTATPTSCWSTCTCPPAAARRSSGGVLARPSRRCGFSHSRCPTRRRCDRGDPRRSTRLRRPRRSRAPSCVDAIAASPTTTRCSRRGSPASCSTRSPPCRSTPSIPSSISSPRASARCCD